jgi:hypothetical protein
MQELKKIFSDRGCELFSTECNSSADILEYKCKCGRLVHDSFHRFRSREKPCPNCNLPLVEDVQKLFTDLGAIPLFTEYTGTKQQLKYICICKEECTTVYGRIVTGQLCKKCGDNKKKHTFEYVKKYFEENSCTLLSTVYINSMSELTYMCNCGNPNPVITTFNRFKNGSRCVKCANFKADLEKASKLMSEKGCTLLTVYANYNGYLKYTCRCSKELSVEYRQFMKCHETWNGCKDCLIKSQRKPYDDIFDLFEHRGIILLHAKEEYTDRHQKLLCICVCSRVAQLCVSEVSRGRLCSGCKDERREETNLQLYNVKNPFQSEEIKIKIRTTMMERYGYEHNFQNPETLMKALKNNYRRKQYTFPSGETIYVQGYEPYALDYILQHTDEKDIVTDCSLMPEIRYFDPEKKVFRRYYPDIYLPKNNIILEVKSQYTYDMQKETNIAKFKEVMKAGYTMELHIYNDDGKLIKKCINEF